MRLARSSWTRRLSLRDLGDVAVGHAESEALHDGRLAYARVAHEDGVVLGAAGEDLGEAADLLVPPDNRIQLAEPRHLREVPAVLFEGLVLPLGILVSDALGPADVLEGAEKEVPVEARGLEGLPGFRPGGLQKGGEDVLRGNEFVLEEACLSHGGLKNLERLTRQGRLLAVAHELGRLVENAVEPVGEGEHVHLQALQDGGHHAPLLLNQHAEDMFRRDFGVMPGGGHFDGAVQGFLGFFGELFPTHPNGLLSAKISKSSNNINS